MMKDWVVKEALKSVNAKPRNFAELQKELNAYDGLGIRVSPETGPAIDIFLNNRVFSNFAFHHLEGNKVAVRLLPDYGCEAGRNMMTQLGILLPVPAELKKSFAAANAGKNGFLMKDSAAKGKSTDIEKVEEECI